MPKIKFRRGLAGLNLVMVLTFVFGGFSLVEAAPLSGVVINEVAWAGSADSSTDEWIELYNNSGSPVDLTGWTIKDDGVTSFTFPAATIAANSYFLLEDSESSVNDVQSDLIYNMSLANSGDSLELLNASGLPVDIVNAAGGAWYAGTTTGYVSMERIDPAIGDLATNFGSSTGSFAHGRLGTLIKGTPKQKNSVANFSDTSPKIFADNSGVTPASGADFTIAYQAQNLTDLFAYGIEVDYDAAALQFAGVTRGSFLSESDNVETSFQSGLLDGQPGKLLVAEARTVSPKTGVSGSGNLFLLTFKVLAANGSQTVLSTGPNSFASAVSGDLTSPIQGANISIGAAPVTLGPVTALVAGPDLARYAIKLQWTAPASGADSYQIERKNAHGSYVLLGSTLTTSFVDSDAILAGGKIIPHLSYSYRVTAIKGGQSATAVEVLGTENRGLKGDNTRSDLIDGRDLENLAVHFAETDANANFDRLVDTTYDGVINGSDLIDIGANFASVY